MCKRVEFAKDNNRVWTCLHIVSEHIFPNLLRVKGQTHFLRIACFCQIVSLKLFWFGYFSHCLLRYSHVAPDIVTNHYCILLHSEMQFYLEDFNPNPNSQGIGNQVQEVYWLILGILNPCSEMGIHSPSFWRRARAFQILVQYF